MYGELLVKPDRSHYENLRDGFPLDLEYVRSLAEEKQKRASCCDNLRRSFVASKPAITAYIADIIKSVYDTLPKGTSIGINAETLDDTSFTLTFEVDSTAG